MKLLLPSIKYKKSYLQALKEGEGEVSRTPLSQPKEEESFEEFVKNLRLQAKGLNLPDGWVPASEFWLVEKDEFIGRVSIRHTLNEHLLKLGGHIGYHIRIRKRKMGYGKVILKLALLEAKKLGLTKILITCDDDNVGSQKIIEENGGVLENIVDVGKDLPLKRRYWIRIP